MTEKARLGIVLFNLGGPDSPAAIEPFLRNLFSDPAIIRLPNPFRSLLAKLISRKRAPQAAEIYARIGGRSPILAETEAQARALELCLSARGIDARCVVAMRYWNPRAEEAAVALKAAEVERIVLLPLYPQYSTTTTQSSFDDWDRAAAKIGLGLPTHRVCCYPTAPLFVKAYARRIRQTLAQAGISDPRELRFLFSAHGLPQRIVDQGDPYPLQVAASVAEIVRSLGISGLDHRITYQSRVGPLKWIGPATDDEIRAAGREGRGVVVVPVSFVSEHSETLVELDIEYAELAAQSGVPLYLRVPAVGTENHFIEGLGDAVAAAWERGRGSDWSCPAARRCAGPRAHGTGA